MKTVNELFQYAVQNYGDSTAIIEGEKSVNYRTLMAMVGNLSKFLLSRGIKKGDRVAILLPNSIEFVSAFFSISKVGAVSVPINTSYKEQEVTFYVQHSGSTMILTNSELKPLADRVAVKTTSSVVVVKGDDPEWVYETDAKYTIDPINIEPGDEAIYLYSTGSTGKPKRVSRTHFNLVALADNHTETVGWSREDKILFTVPISHTYGFGNFISAVKIGAGVVTMGDFDRHKVLDILDKEQINIFPAVPVMLDVLAKTYLPRPIKLPSLKLVISAGAALGESTFRKFHESFGIYPRQLYGSTETGVISINLGEDIENTFKSVGQAVNNVEVRVLNQKGQVADVDEVGDITVKSPSMTSGYYGLVEETAEVFKNGYYYTGDLGRIDRDGFIYIVGRKKFFINVGGNKVDPIEVESLLLEYPGVTEAAVLGVTDGGGNERVKAVLVTEVGIEKTDILKYCKHSMADFKIPGIIEFRPELPRSPTGKVLREKLK